MNVTFNGYLTLTCKDCQKKLSVESKELSFERDESPEAEDDQYIRYVTQVDTYCDNCSAKLHVKLDVWEYPEAVANYSYYGEQGAKDIQCEFNVEHYFDDDAKHERVDSWDDGSTEGDDTDDLETDGFDAEIGFNEDESGFHGVSNHDSDSYQDHYDEEDN